MLSLSDGLDRVAPQGWPAGARVQTRGQVASHIHYLVAGQVSLGLWQNGRWVHRQGSLLAPDWVDLSVALLDGQVSVDAVADNEVVIKSVPLAQFRGWLLEQPTAVQGMLRSLARQQHDWAQTTLSRLALDAHARCAQWLLSQTDTTGSAHSVQLTLRKRQIAEQLGMAPETLSRILRDLREQGLIHGRGRMLHVVDAGRLRSMSLAA